MKPEKRHKPGINLVELIVIAVTMVILTAVAIPLMSSNRQRAVAAEAESVLRKIRVALRVQHEETGAYNLGPNGENVTRPTDVAGISEDDLTGYWWSPACYRFREISESNYVLVATGLATNETRGMAVGMDDQGVLRHLEPRK